ncbi:MAG: PEF-CTERM sorting domain-containing protein [Candidatus Methanoperedens sp.]|nr:PEF-CTERM sorting domain-containing protein [Candidatus Methanoperedens sp.]
MKNKIITINAVLAVMVAMIGIAAATTADLKVTNDPLTLDIGASGTQDVTLTLDPAGTNDVKAIAIVGLPPGISSKIDGHSGTHLIGPWTSPKTWNVEFTNNGAANGEYTITYDVVYTNDQHKLRLATIQAGITTIPEFPTVALPVAAAIGLVFFFQHRKNKKE